MHCFNDHNHRPRLNETNIPAVWKCSKCGGAKIKELTTIEKREAHQTCNDFNVHRNAANGMAANNNGIVANNNDNDNNV